MKICSKLSPSGIFVLFLAFQFLISSNLLGACVFQSEIETQELEIGNLLTWVTVTEIDNEKFIIQKSDDGVIFKDVGVLDGAGSSEEENSYRFLDTKIGDLINFYRIVFVDSDQNKYHTPTVVVSRKTENNFMVTGMSTTVTDKDFSLTLRSAVEGNMMVTISGAGDEFNINWDLVKGANMIAIDLEKVSIGLYKIKLEMEKESEILIIKKVAQSDAPFLSFIVKE